MNWWNNFHLQKKREKHQWLYLYLSDLDVEAIKDILAQNKATAQRSRRTWVAGIDGDIKNM